MRKKYIPGSESFFCLRQIKLIRIHITAWYIVEAMASRVLRVPYFTFNWFCPKRTVSMVERLLPDTLLLFRLLPALGLGR